jgi:DNA replication and repair protein RecF
MFRRLQVNQFRNLKAQKISFGPNVNIFVGENGQGKTNILEALYILATGDSFRYADNENYIQKKFSECLLRAEFFHGELEFELTTQILKSRKVHSLNGKRATASELSKKFPIVVFSPESLAAIKEGDDQRRQLVDELLVTIDPKNADLIVDFRKALRSRNKILKNYLDQNTDRNTTEALLESINPSFMKLAVELSVNRIAALRALLPEFNKTMQMITKSNAVDISVEYVISSVNSLNLDAKSVEKLLVNRLHQLHDAELGSGSTLVGPHKHDITFLYGQNDSRFFCSQGQQRALILSFKMAQIVYHRNAHGAYPVLMLDDVLSELDSEKRNSLIKFLGDIKTQIFLTTTDFDLPGSLAAGSESEDAVVLKVRDGQIER